MSAIPAPNIAQNALESQQVQTNSLAEYARAAQEKQQTALIQQQTQAAAQENQIRAQQMKDQDALTKTLTQYDPAKHSINDIPQLITSNGGSGAAALQAQQGLIAQRKNLSSLSDEQFAQEQKKADLISGMHDTVSQAPPEQKNELYQQGLRQLSSAGVDVSKEPIEYPGDDVFAQHLPAIRLHSALVAEAEKDRETTAKEQEAAAKTTEANAKNIEAIPQLGITLDKSTGQTKPIAGAAGVMPPQMMESKYVALAQKKASGQPISKDDAAWMQGYEKYKTLVPVANFNLQNAGAAVDSGGNPSQIAQALANNSMKWSEAVSPRTPQAVKNQIMAQVFKLNPNYDTGEFGLEQEAAKKARSGAWADTRLAYNTAIDHADQLLAASDALKNGDVQKLNQLKNYFSTQFGSPDASTAQAIANAYNHEVTSVVAKGHMTDAEVAQGHGVLDVNKASPEQIKGVAQAYKNLMTSKRDELDKIIKAGAGAKANAVTGVQSGDQPPQNDFFSKFGGKARPQANQ